MNVTQYANSLFEQPWWLDIVAPGHWEEAVVKDDAGKVLARMPYVVGNNRIVMPPMTQNLGVWMDASVKSDYGAQKKVLTEIFGQFAKKRAVLQRLSPNNDYVLPVRWLGYNMKPGFTYRLTDLNDCEALYQAFNKTAKKNIKYARNKVKIYTETSPETLWDLLNRTFEGQNRKNPMSKELVMKIIQVCEELGHGKYMEARDDDGNVHSCAYFVYDENVCYYLMGASDNAFRNSGAQSLILWEGIQYAAQHSKVFDFEGSMIEGIENFFRQFGGVCTPYYEVSRNTLMDELFAVLKPRIKRLLGYKI